MQSTARATLVDLVKEQISDLIRDAITVQRHEKRTRVHETSSNDTDGRPLVRRRLHAADINMALQLNGSEKLYATAVVPPDPEAPTRKVPLQDFLRTSADRMPSAPSEISYNMRWLAVDGRPPEPPSVRGPVVIEGTTTTTTSTSDQHSTTQLGGSTSLKVNQLQSSLLSEELQLYFSRVTTAVERGGGTAHTRQQQDAVLRSLQRDPGLQELVPFLVRYCQQELYKYVTHNLDHCRTLVRLARALLENPHVHLELHLHELLPVLVTCVVAKKLPSDYHWALRREAAQALLEACDMFGAEYATLKARVLRALCDAVGRNEDGTPPSLPSQYGGMIAITYFGSRAIDAFLLPVILESWPLWEQALADDLNMTTQHCMELQMCQMACLEALSSFLRHTSPEEKAARLDRNDLEDIMGDKLTVLEEEAGEYISCFV